MSSGNRRAGLDEGARASLRRTIAAKRWMHRRVTAVAEAAVIVGDALQAGNKVLLCGNGGSAADAQHVAAELTGRYVVERAPLAAVALTTDTSALTAIANDYGYDQVFSRQVEALGRPGDVLIAISTSGNSPSVVEALLAAKRIGMPTIAMTGGRPSRSGELADLLLAAPATETARIQECHIFFGHLICELLELPDEPVPTVTGGGFASYDDAGFLELRRGWAEAGLRVVLTNGIFDLLHAGHVTSLDAARDLGDVLVVAVNADATATRLKGPGRPVNSEQDRLRVVAALEAVDAAVLFTEDDASAVVERLQPEVWCKGGDYSDDALRAAPEATVVAAYGGEVVALPFLEGRSTTATLTRVRESAPRDA